MDIIDTIIVTIVKLTAIPVLLGGSAWLFDKGMTKFFKIVKIYSAIFNFVWYDYGRRGQEDRMTYAKALETITELESELKEANRKILALEVDIHNLTTDEQTPESEWKDV